MQPMHGANQTVAIHPPSADPRPAMRAQIPRHRQSGRGPPDHQIHIQQLRPHGAVGNVMAIGDRMPELRQDLPIAFGKAAIAGQRRGGFGAVYRQKHTRHYPADTPGTQPADTRKRRLPACFRLRRSCFDQRRAQPIGPAQKLANQTSRAKSFAQSPQPWQDRTTQRGEIWQQH